MSFPVGKALRPVVSGLREGRPARWLSPGRGRLLQYRHETGLTAEEYVSRRAWREARAPACLRGRLSGCGQWRHGTYARKTPAGMRVSRWYCRPCRTSFSALPDCLSARLPGPLSSAEAVAAFAEERGIHAAARRWRGEAADFSSARRWVRRRVVLVGGCLSVFRGLEAVLLAGLVLSVGAFRARLEAPVALIELRRIGSSRLQSLPYPVGFDLRWRSFGSQTGPPTEDGSAQGVSLPRRW